jgi:hypothetical protein
MYDRPNLQELLDAVRMHLETAIIPAVREDRKLYFQTLVAVNVLKIAERELQLSDGHLRAEWGRLNSIEGASSPTPSSDAELRTAMAERNRALCSHIRAGNFDKGADALFAHLKASTVEQLQVANPKYLGTLAREDQNPELDAWHNRHSL